MVKNYLTLPERKKIDSLINSIRLDTGKSYPDDSLIDIVETAIPGVELFEDDFKGLEESVDPKTIRGMIFKKSKAFSKPRILIQKNLDPEVKTFTLAHEFGHYVLAHPGDKNYYLDRINYDGSLRSQLESQAQYFAASLLMPAAEFLWLAKALDDKALARRFGVSVAAVKVRKEWLKNDT